MTLLLFFSQQTPLHHSAFFGYLEITRLLVESKADVAARDSMCFSPPPSHHLSLTICLAAGVALHSNWPSTTTTLLHTCAASALLNDAPPRAAAAQIKNTSCSRLVSAAVRGCYCSKYNRNLVLLLTLTIRGGLPPFWSSEGDSSNNLPQRCLCHSSAAPSTPSAMIKCWANGTLKFG